MPWFFFFDLLLISSASSASALLDYYSLQQQQEERERERKKGQEQGDTPESLGGLTSSLLLSPIYITNGFWLPNDLPHSRQRSSISQHKQGLFQALWESKPPPEMLNICWLFVQKTYTPPFHKSAWYILFHLFSRWAQDGIYESPAFQPRYISLTYVWRSDWPKIA